MLNGKLITFYASDGLKLKGYLALGNHNLATIVHFHGNFGNFYENDFIMTMAEMYVEAGINFLSANNRGHDGIAEAYQHCRLVYIGAASESPEDCILDIQGAVDFASGLGTRVILQAHSFGCLKVLAYDLKTRAPFDLILLSPADTYRLQSNYIAPEGLRILVVLPPS